MSETPGGARRMRNLLNKPSLNFYFKKSLFNYGDCAVSETPGGARWTCILLNTRAFK